MGELTKPIAGVCGKCGNPVRNREPYSYREVVAWQKLGRSGGRGGGLYEIRPTGRVVCRACHPSELGGQGELLLDV